jgi:hypothetical protein
MNPMQFKMGSRPSRGPFPHSLKKVHAFAFLNGHAFALCSGKYVEPPYRTDTHARVTCSRCQSKIKQL